MSTTPLTSDERQTVAAIADMLIPPSPKGFSASQAGIAGPLLDALEIHVPERLALVRRVIALQAGRTPQGGLDALRQEDAAAYDSFCETVAALYFMAPQVRERVGFPGRLPKLARVDVTDLEELLIPVLEAGFGPRETD
jgi:hypothetical protein